MAGKATNSIPSKEIKKLYLLDPRGAEWGGRRFIVSADGRFLVHPSEEEHESIARDMLGYKNVSWDNMDRPMKDGHIMGGLSMDTLILGTSTSLPAIDKVIQLVEASPVEKATISVANFGKNSSKSSSGLELAPTDNKTVLRALRSLRQSIIDNKGRGRPSKLDGWERAY